MQVYNDELYHFGKRGMKWGKRKIRAIKKNIKAKDQRYKQSFSEEQRNKHKKIIKIGVVSVATMLAAYGSYKIYDKSVPRNVEVTKYVNQVVGRQHVGKGLNGFPRYMPIFENVPHTETIVNDARKYFK